MVEDDTIYVSNEADMVAYDQLPLALKKFLDEAPEGLPATPVLELYQEKIEKLTPLYSEGEVQQMMIKTLTEVQRRDGFTDFRKVVARPGTKKHRERKMRLPKKLMQVGDGR
jgi:hypothetical protein